MLRKIAIISLLCSFFSPAAEEMPYCPFSDEALTKLSGLMTRLDELEKNSPPYDDKEAYTRHSEEREKVDNEINSTCKRYGRGVLPIDMDVKPDLAKLPLSGQSEKELADAVEQGNGEAAMELVLRWSLFSNETPWSRYNQVKKWLGKARELKQPGSEFLWNYLFGDKPAENKDDNKEKDDNPFDQTAGFDEFLTAINEGKYRQIRILQAYVSQNQAEREWVQKWVKELEQKGIDGDKSARLQYAKLVLPFRQQHSYSSNNTSKIEDWYREIGDRGDIEAMYAWLMQTNRSSYSEEQIKRFFNYLFTVLNSGYIPAYNYSFFTQAGQSMKSYNFINYSFPSTEVYTLSSELAKNAAKRESLSVLNESDSIRMDNGDARRQTMIKNAQKAITLGSSYHMEMNLRNPTVWISGRLRFFGYNENTDLFLHSVVFPAAEQGNIDAKNMMAHAYFYGVGVQENTDKAVKLWQEVISALEPNQDNRFFKMGAVVNNIRSIMIRADMRNPDANREEIHQQAIELETKSKEQGLQTNHTLNYVLGYMYDTGYGTKEDPKKAMQYYQKSSSMPESLNNMGCLYEEGRGVEQNIDQAIQTYQRAAHSKYAPAIENYTRLTGKSPESY